jgi:hypothetical protein
MQRPSEKRTGRGWIGEPNVRRVLRPLPAVMRARLDDANRMIALYEKRVKQAEENPDVLSSEAGRLVPLRLLKAGYERSLRTWKLARKRLLRQFRNLGFEAN